MSLNSRMTWMAARRIIPRPVDVIIGLLAAAAVYLQLKPEPPVMVVVTVAFILALAALRLTMRAILIWWKLRKLRKKAAHGIGSLKKMFEPK